MRPFRAALATATATVVTAGLMAAAAPAAQAAEDKAPHGVVLGSVRVDGDSAFVTGRYRCFGGHQAHLWASIKQGPDINGTTQTSSQYADSWYDTNYNFTESTPEGLTVPCDGAWHTEEFELRRVFGTPWGAPFVGDPLQAGMQAWVQFCLVPGEHDGGSSFNEFKNVKTG